MKYFRESFDLKVKEKILAGYGKTLASFKKDVEDVKVWLKTQPHLPQVLNDHQIETYIILCKCNSEKVKPKIDAYFTMHSRFPDVFANSHPFSQRVREAQKFIYLVPLPKLCSDFNRIFVMKIKPVPDPLETDFYACLALLLNIIEVRLLEDTCDGHISLVDLEHAKLGHAAKVTPMFIKTFFTISDKALTTRMAAVHLINAPSFIDQTLLLIKSLVKPKLAERMIIHKEPSKALESIDKNILPKDYGGNEKSLDELEADFYKKFEEYKDFFDKRQGLRVDEDLRPEKYKDEGFFGRYGNFKQLQVD